MSTETKTVKPLDPATLAKEEAKTRKQIEAAGKKAATLWEEAERIGTEYTKTQTRLRDLGKKGREALNKRDDVLSRKEDLEMRLRFLPLVGVEGGVKTAELVPDDHADAALNNLVGTITEIRRTRCTVEFGDGSNWNTDFHWIIPATEERGNDVEDAQ